MVFCLQLFLIIPKMIVRAISTLSRLKSQQILRLFSKDGFKDKGEDEKGFFSKKASNKDRQKSNSNSFSNDNNDRRPSQQNSKGRQDGDYKNRQHFKFNKKFQGELPKSRTEYYNKHKAKAMAPQQKKQSERFSHINQQQSIAKQSIFFGTQEAQQTPNTVTAVHSVPKATRLSMLTIETGVQNKFYNRLCQTDEILRSSLNTHNFAKLTELLIEYSTMANILQIQREIMPLLISQNVVAYLAYLDSTQKQIKTMPQKILQRIFNQLLSLQKYQELSNFLGKLKQGQFKIQFSNLEIIFNDIPIINNIGTQGVNLGSIGVIEQKLRVKSALVLKILANQHRYYDRLMKIKKDKQVEPEKIGRWFFVMSELALKQNIGKSNFVRLFEEIVYKYSTFISLQRFYISEYFPLLFQKHYFGSHITSKLLLEIIANVSLNNSLFPCLSALKEALTLYKTKHHKTPFPNVKSFIHHLNNKKPQQINQNALLILTLAFYQGQENEVFDYLKGLGGKRVIQMAKENDLYEVISSFYLGMEKDKLKRQQNKDNDNDRKGKGSGSTEEGGRQKQKSYISYLVQQIKSQKNENRLLLLFEILNYFQSKLDLDKILLKLKPEQVRLIRSQLNKQQKSTTPQPHSQDNLALFFQQYEQYINNDAEDQSILSQAQALLLSEIQEQSRPSVIKNSKFQDLAWQDKKKLKKTISAVRQQVLKFAEEIYEMEEMDMQMDEAEYAANAMENENNQEQQEEQEEYQSVDDHGEGLPQGKILDAVKASIRLGKLEIAYHIFEAQFMDKLIIERYRKNIQFALRSFMLESYQQQQQHLTTLPEIIEQVEQSINSIGPQFIKSIYTRSQNFDELIYTYLPPDSIKYHFWNTTLMMDRSQQLLKMDASYKMNQIKYVPQFNVLGRRERQQYVQDHRMSWRRRLNEELGIIDGSRHRRQAQTDQIVQFSNQAELMDQIHDDFMNMDKVVKYKEEHRIPLNEWEEVIVSKMSNQAQQPVAEEVAEEVAEDAVEEAQMIESAAEGQLVEQETVEQQGQMRAQGQQQEQVTIAVEEPTASQQSLNIQIITPEVAQSFSIQDKLNLLKRKQKSLNIKGYDFTSFLELARTDIKPLLEQNYESEKQFKKHCINLESLVEQAMISDNHSLQKKLIQFQQNVKSLENIAVFNAYGLWNFDFQTVEQPQDYLKLTNQFRLRYFQFKKYKGKKGFDRDISFNNRLAIIEKQQLQINLTASQTVIIDILLKKNHHFKKAEAIVKIKPREQVEELMKWGLLNDEPMAIYLSQKLAMITNQVISPPLASRVSEYLSHRRVIPQQRIERCKQCLKIVGRINREHIYDFNVDYQHITVRKHFQGYLQSEQQKLNSAALQFMLRVDPTHSYQEEKFNLVHNIRKGTLTV